MSLVPTDKDRAFEEGWNERSAEIEALYARLAEAERERDECLRLKNELVLKAYPAMDAVDAAREALRTWDTPTDMSLLELARIRRDQIGQLEAALRYEKARAEAAEAEIERLKNELGDPEGVIAHANAITKMSEEAKARAESLSAQLAKAREALEEIAETDVIYPPHDPGNYFAPEGREGPCAKIARAALTPSPASKDKSQSE